MAPDMVLWFNPAALKSVNALLLIKAHLSTIGMQFFFHVNMRGVYSPHREGQSLNHS